MKITEFQIDRYGPLHHPRTECDGGLEVYYGPNESGKTLLLEGLLRMLDPDIESTMDGIDRVRDPPAGYLVVESGDEAYQLGDGQVLGDVAPVTPTHLRNIFVVRDSDLRIRQHHQFYDSVTEQIGDLHTSEIEAIQDRLVELGRLQPKQRNVSSAARYDDAGKVRDDARKLAGDLRDYVETATDEGLDDLESELIDTRSRLRRVRSELEEQRRAERAKEHARLSSQLEKVERLEADRQRLRDFTRGTLERLTSIDTTISNDRGQIEKLEGQIDELHQENERLESESTALESDVRPMEEREGSIDDVEATLEAVRDETSATTGADRRMGITRLVALLGLGLGGAATLYGVIQGQPQLLLPLLLLAIGIGGGILWYVDYRRVTAVERERTSLLENARDAGLEVDEVSDIGPSITEFKTELGAKREQVNEREREIEVNEGLISEHSETIDDHRGEIRELESEKAGLLEEAGVTSIEEYRENVDDLDAIEDELGPAEQSLVDAFGEPVGDDDRIEYWHAELDDSIAEIDVDDVDPNDYDEDRLDELEDEKETLEDRSGGLRDDLESHRHELDQFDDRVDGLNTDPFVEDQLRLEARSVDGLRQLAEELEALAMRIDRDAEISRAALEIFDDLHQEEEAKISDLFEPGGRASEVFGTITDERYDRVDYDSDERRLKVHRNNGTVHTASELSHGARDQLYLATRISLAEQLLDSEPGFFLMDDAFLPADTDRLHSGFRVLERLVEDGWQVIYLTAKEEVGVDLVDQLGLPCSELEPLP